MVVNRFVILGDFYPIKLRVDQALWPFWKGKLNLRRTIRSTLFYDFDKLNAGIKKRLREEERRPLNDRGDALEKGLDRSMVTK